MAKTKKQIAAATKTIRRWESRQFWMQFGEGFLAASCLWFLAWLFF